MKNEITDYILKNKIINDYFDKVEIEYKKDFKNHIWLIIMEALNNETKLKRIKDLYSKNELGKYIIGIINNQLKSNTSSFTKQFKYKYTEYGETIDNRLDDIVEHIETDNTITNIISILDNVYFVDAVLFKLYFGIDPLTNKLTEPKTYQEIQALIGINYQSVRGSVLKVQKVIKEKIKI